MDGLVGVGAIKQMNCKNSFCDVFTSDGVNSANPASQNNPNEIVYNRIHRSSFERLPDPLNFDLAFPVDLRC